MANKKYKDIEPQRYKDVDISKYYEQKMFSSLCVPSMNHTYSLCIEYMRNWFLTKFDDTFFRSVYLDGKHVFDDFRRMTKDEMLKIIKPAVSITPQIDFSFDRDKLDLYVGGLDMYLNKAYHRDTFFKDFVRKVFISLTMEIVQMTFTYRIKMSTKAQAIDLFKYMQLAFRVGSTQGHYINMDLHVPYKLMLQLAEDCGFSVKDNKVVDIFGFLYYLNKNSQLPFLYKLRTVTGNNEFFVRITDAYVHINTPDISCDDGEREGQLYSNFVVEMQSTVRFPASKFYAYFSSCKHENINIKENDEHITSYSLEMTKVPIVNDKGWNQYMDAEYLNEDKSRPVKIQFNEILEELIPLIDHTKKLHLSPSLFIDIKLFNNFKEKPISIDWCDFIITVNDVMESDMSYIVVYADPQYINEQTTNIKEYNKNRLK